MAGQLRNKGKKGGRTTPKGTRPGGSSTSEDQADLDDLLATVIRSVPDVDSEDVGPFVLEIWAAGMWSTLHSAEPTHADPDELFAGGLISFAVRTGSPQSLLALRAMAAVVPEPYRTRAGQAADRLAGAGVAEPDWAPMLGRCDPIDAWTAFDPVHDDGDWGDEDWGVDEDEFDALLSDFLASGELDAQLAEVPDEDRHRRPETIGILATQVVAFTTRYVVVTPLCFSPVMAEIFCLDWAPRTIAADEQDFELLPDVAAAWIRFAGRRRGIPDASINEAVEALYHHAPEMMELVGDPSPWGPAELMVRSLQERGIDITDTAAVQEFVDQTNRAGGIDALLPPGSAER